MKIPKISIDLNFDWLKKAKLVELKDIDISSDPVRPDLPISWRINHGRKMFVLYYGVIDFYIGFLAGIKAFTAAVLGGIGSLPGAMLGGLLIGLIETMWSGYVSIEYKDVAAFSVLIVVLIFFPTGFLGKPDIEKV